jgi:hypothetical protein
MGYVFLIAISTVQKIPEKFHLSEDIKRWQYIPSASRMDKKTEDRPKSVRQ